MDLLIGFGYKAQSGKDTCAKYLSEKLGFTHMGFANELKRIATDQFGWDGKKDDKSRRFLQELGKVARLYNKNFWIEQLTKSEQYKSAGNVVISDVRFPNEVEWIQNNGGFVVQIVGRGGLKGDAGKDTSETSLDNFDGWDFVIDNSGGYEELYEQINIFLSGAPVDLGIPGV